MMSAGASRSGAGTWDDNETDSDNSAGNDIETDKQVVCCRASQARPSRERSPIRTWLSIDEVVSDGALQVSDADVDPQAMASSQANVSTEERPVSESVCGVTTRQSLGCGACRRAREDARDSFVLEGDSETCLSTAQRIEVRSVRRWNASESMSFGILLGRQLFALGHK